MEREERKSKQERKLRPKASIGSVKEAKEEN